MNEKREELEAIADLLHEWAVKYDEPYVTMVAYNEPEYRMYMVNIRTGRPDYEAMCLFKNYETPACE